LHNRGHRAAQSATIAYLAVLGAPVLHQHLNFIDHRPIPPKNRTQHRKPQPNTNPTQINLFKINIFNNFELSVLGLLGLSVLA
jgi:hypothetical protein